MAEHLTERQKKWFALPYRFEGRSERLKAPVSPA